MSGYYNITGKPGEWYTEAWMGNRPRSTGGPFYTAKAAVLWMGRHGVKREYLQEWLEAQQKEEYERTLFNVIEDDRIEAVIHDTQP